MLWQLVSCNYATTTRGNCTTAKALWQRDLVIKREGIEVSYYCSYKLRIKTRVIHQNVPPAFDNFNFSALG